MDNLQQYITELESQIISLELKVLELTKEQKQILSSYQHSLKQVENEIANKYANAADVSEDENSIFDQIVPILNQNKLNQTLKQIYKL